MIVVSLKRSYPNLIDDVREKRAVSPDRLESITRGNWPKMSPSTLEGYLDFVVGAYDNMIVSAFPVERVEAEASDTIRFVADEEDLGFAARYEKDLSSNAPPKRGEWLIGCPMPGGPWRQGESRGTRRYSLDAYVGDHPELADRIGVDLGGRMAENLVQHFALGKPLAVEDYPQLASPAGSAPATLPSTGVTVVRQPGGTVLITIPTGTRAQITIDPSDY